MKNRKKRVAWILIVTLIACLLVGCGDEIPDLTEEQNRMISEYAVGLLMKHDNKKYSRLVEVPEEEELQTYIEETLPDEADSEQLVPEENVEDAVEGAEEIADSAEIFYDDTTVAKFLGFNGISIDYSHYSVASTYPENNSAVYYACDAREGYKFIILYFDITNNTDSEAAVDLTRYRVRYSLSLDGKKYRSSQSTLDPSDISYYKSTLLAGEKRECACVFEFPDELCSQIDIMLLEMKKNNDRTTIKLEGSGGKIAELDRKTETSLEENAETASDIEKQVSTEVVDDTKVTDRVEDAVDGDASTNIDSSVNKMQKETPGYTTNEDNEVEVLYYSVN